MAISPGPYLKAIVAGTLAGLGKLYLALGDNTVTGQEGVEIAIYAITAAAAIYGVPNTPPAKQDSTPQQTPTQQIPTQQIPTPTYLPPAPATQWPAAAIGQANTNAATDAAALAAAAAARTAQGTATQSGASA